MIISKDKDGKPTVIVNGEVVADAAKILSEIEPLRQGFAYHISEDGDVVMNAKEIRKISRDAARNAREQIKNPSSGDGTGGN